MTAAIPMASRSLVPTDQISMLGGSFSSHEPSAAAGAIRSE